jgi:hypothetical protein
LGLDRTGFSPRVQQKIVYAGVAGASFQEASHHLAELAGLEVEPKPVERLVKRIGRERIEQRDAAVAAHQELPLMEKDAVADARRPSPAVAMVSVDGGRLQVRSGPATEPGSGPTSHWRESKVAVLETYVGAIHEEDPDPDVPRCFLDLERTADVVRGLGHALPVGLSFEEDQAEAPQPLQESAREPEASSEPHGRSVRPGRPGRLVRSVLASRACSDDFGPMVHQAAWERNFFGAQRPVFLGDGLPVNWTIHREHFSTFTPIVDFVHALSYVFSAAFAGRTAAEGAVIYRGWIQAVWAGRVEAILPELEARSAELGAPPADGGDSDPRSLVSDALRYLRNNKGRMRYGEYRRAGLPIMTSAVESVIKRINQRVKGSEKFWSEPGAEAILQMRADYLSETDVMNRFWRARETRTPSGRVYRRAS